jgi:predicted aldo/keto reductase-like oxidoreductase
MIDDCMKLGFGMMRLPRMEGTNDIDLEHTKRMVVLSGMSNMEQMEDNLSFMQDFHPLTEEEHRVLEEANKTMKQFADIPCTACHYCTPGCPAGIHIPEIFAVMNVYKMYGNLTEARNEYRWRPGGALASACIVCG